MKGTVHCTVEKGQISCEKNVKIKIVCLNICNCAHFLLFFLFFLDACDISKTY